VIHNRAADNLDTLDEEIDMHRRFSVATALFLALQALCTPSPAADAPLTGDTAEAAQVWATFEHWMKAYEAGDLDGIMAIFDPAVIFEFQGGPDATADMLRRDYAADLKSRMSGTRWVPQVEEVHAEGSTAFVRSMWELHVGDKVTQRNRSMDVFQRRDGHWSILRSMNYPAKGRPAC
jgi:ketosteroid isomerase-like protein